MKIKLLLIIIAILFVAVLYLLYLNLQNPMKPLVETQLPMVSPTKVVAPAKLITPTTVIDQTTAWKRYDSKQYGFSFEYPSTLTFNSTGPNSSQQALDKNQTISGTVAPSYETLELSGNEVSFKLGIFHSVSNLSDLSFDGSCGSQFATETLVDKIQKNNSITYREIQQKLDTGINIQYCFLSGTKNLLVLSTYEISPQNISFVKQSMNQILSTFKFNQTTVFKTFTNDLYGYQIDYPSNWVPIAHSSNFQNISEFSKSPTNLSQNIFIESSADIDIYSNVAPQVVNERFTLDNGFKNSTVNKTIAGYSVAITTTESNPPKTLVTFKHPTKNLYVSITSGIPVTLLNQILSTYKFTN